MTVFQKCFKKFLPRKLTLSVPCVTITVLEVLFWVNKNPHFTMELEHNPPYWGSGQVWQTATSTTGPHGPVVDTWLKAQLSQWNMEWPVDAAYLRCDPLQLQCCKILNEIFLAAGQSSQTLPALLTCPSAVQISPFHTCFWEDWIKELLLYLTAVPVTSVASCGRDLHHHYSIGDARQGITGLCTECGDQRTITMMCKKTGWVRNTWWIWNKKKKNLLQLRGKILWNR
jgi:hypothetical protein